MMVALSLNGLTAPVAQEGWSTELVELGDRSRSFSGKSLATVRRRYRKHSGSLLSTDDELSEAWLGLINGDGIGWSFNTDLYADNKGLGPDSGYTATVVASDGGVSPKYGAKMLKVPATTSIVWTHGWSAAYYTAMVWSYTSGAWHHYLKRSDTGSGYWTDGVYGAGSLAYLTATSTAVTLSGDAGAARDFDDLVVFPFLVPTSWISTIISGVFTKPPYLTGAGTLLTYTAATLRGTAKKIDITNRGASNPLAKIAIELEED